MTPIALISVDAEKPLVPHGPQKPSSLKKPSAVSRRLIRRAPLLALGAFLLGCTVPPVFAQTALPDTVGVTKLDSNGQVIETLNYDYGSQNNSYFMSKGWSPFFLLENQDSDGWTQIINAAKDAKEKQLSDPNGFATYINNPAPGDPNNPTTPVQKYLAGLDAVDWGWRRQMSDGSIPYDNHGSNDSFDDPDPSRDWQQYHSLATFCAQGGWALTRLLDSPLVTSVNTNTLSRSNMYETNKVSATEINKKITSLIGKLNKSALWLTNNSDYKGVHEGTGTGQTDVQGDGKYHDGPYSHRRMMLAAVCFQVAKLKGTSSQYYNELISQGTAYALEGLRCPLPSGAKAVLVPNSPDPAMLYKVPPSYSAPPGISLNTYEAAGTSPPANGVFISASGVTPESANELVPNMGGFDITYQTDYATLGVYAADACPDTVTDPNTGISLKSEMYAQFDKSLLWLASRLKYNCTALDYTGSTRDGHGLSPDQSGNVKIPNIPSVRQAFLLMAQRSANLAFQDALDQNGNQFYPTQTPDDHKGLWHKIYDNLSNGHADGDDFNNDSALATWPLGSRTHTLYDLNLTLYPSILWLNSSNNNVVVWNNSSSNFNGSLTPQYGQPWDSTVSGPWTIAGVADFDGDGQPDYLWFRADTQQLAIWDMKPGGNVHKTYGTVFSGPGSGWQAASFVDINGDGHPDILWNNPSTQQLMVWYTDGTVQADGTPKIIGTGTAFTVPITSGWQLVGTGDYDSDGVPDLLWYNPSQPTPQQMKIWYSQYVKANGFTTGFSIRKYGTVFAGRGDATWLPVGTGDYNNDGHPDILWYNSSQAAAVQLTVCYTDGMGGSNTTVIGTNYGADFTGPGDANWKVVGVH